MMHLLIGAKPGLLSTFFSLVKKRLCSPELKHCLNVYSVVLCTLGRGLFGHPHKSFWPTEYDGFNWLVSDLSQQQYNRKTNIMGGLTNQFGHANLLF